MKLLARLSILVLLVASLLVAVPVQASAAYGPWTLEHVQTAEQSFWSNQLGRYDYLEVAIYTYHDTGNHKYYVSTAYNYFNTTGAFTSRVRWWICGGSQGSGSASSPSSGVATPYLYYPAGCGRQADNGPSGSSFNGGANSSPPVVTKYVNQG